MVKGQDLFTVSDQQYVPPKFEVLHREANGKLRQVYKVHTEADAKRRVERLNQAHKCDNYSWKKIEDGKENT